MDVFFFEALDESFSKGMGLIQRRGFQGDVVLEPGTVPFAYNEFPPMLLKLFKDVPHPIEQF